MWTRSMLLGGALALGMLVVAEATRGGEVGAAWGGGRTASLALDTLDFGDDGSPEPAITALFSTELPTDVRVRIDTAWRAPNQPEKEGGSTWAERADDGTLWTRWRYPRDEFGSGTELRAVFTAVSRDGVTFTCERRLMLP